MDRLQACDGQVVRVCYAATILAARLDARDAGPASIDELLLQLHGLVEDASAAGSRLDVFEAELAMAEIELEAGRAPAARKRLDALVEYARGRGWELVARRAQALRAR